MNTPKKITQKYRNNHIVIQIKKKKTNRRKDHKLKIEITTMNDHNETVTTMTQ